jgi:hypothetical protein
MEINAATMTQDEWALLPRDDVPAHFSGLYISLNRSGAFTINRMTYERLGKPHAVLIFYSVKLFSLAIKAVEPGTKNSYPVRNQGSKGGKVIRAHRLITHFGIKTPETIEFIAPRFAIDGRLILDLGRIRVSPRAHSQCRREK